ncbi:MAG: hypothetical protein JNK78_15890 [Planctomycetes bacterium]|nr:hypothetical protein [Planctomycetota bacterium]
MSWHGSSRGEWIAAVLVLATSLTGSALLRVWAADLVSATDRRDAQVERFRADPRPSVVKDDAWTGLFPGHVLVPEKAPWGPFLAVHAAPRRVER